MHILKYISDAFEARHAELEAQKAEGADPEDPDEYRAASIFWVPREARWSHLKANTPQPTIGTLVDDAMAAIERDNPSLKPGGRPAAGAGTGACPYAVVTGARAGTGACAYVGGAGTGACAYVVVTGARAGTGACPYAVVTGARAGTGACAYVGGAGTGACAYVGGAGTGACAYQDILGFCKSATLTRKRTAHSSGLPSSQTT